MMQLGCTPVTFTGRRSSICVAQFLQLFCGYSSHYKVAGDLSAVFPGVPRNVPYSFAADSAKEMYHIVSAVGFLFEK